VRGRRRKTSLRSNSPPYPFDRTTLSRPGAAGQRERMPASPRAAGRKYERLRAFKSRPGPALSLVLRNLGDF
jgi:hypothetical protein